MSKHPYSYELRIGSHVIKGYSPSYLRNIASTKASESFEVKDWIIFECFKSKPMIQGSRMGLTETEMDIARSMVERGMKHSIICGKLDISPSYLWKILNRKKYGKKERQTNAG